VDCERISAFLEEGNGLINVTDAAKEVLVDVARVCGSGKVALVSRTVTAPRRKQRIGVAVVYRRASGGHPALMTLVDVVEGVDISATFHTPWSKSVLSCWALATSGDTVEADGRTQGHLL
jgi:hypothetical protein